MVSSKYAKLFEPIKIGKVEIKNRIAMAPMGINGSATLGAGFSQRAIDFYVERARGGVGLIITCLVIVDNNPQKVQAAGRFSPLVNPRHFIHTASELTEGVHAYGGRIFIQLSAGGNGIPTLGAQPLQIFVPSALPNPQNPSQTFKEMTTEEVEKLVAAFGESARIVAAAGFDGIEVHAVHESYLLDQFVMAMFNRRTDKYGGDLRGRLTLPIEILRRVKNETGADFPVQLRYGVKSFIKEGGQGALPGEEFREAGRDIEEGLEAAKILEEAGYDSFDADVGSNEAAYWPHPPPYMEHGCYLPYIQKLKEVVTVPVIVAGRMELPDLATAAIADGKADMVALGRGLLAEPHWPNKVIAGRTDKIRPCLACHDGCMLRLNLAKLVSCAVNPACGREWDYSLKPANETKSVLIIGGGIAGMEAARVAAIRGHKVSLREKSSKLGGHLIEASVPAFKKDVARLMKWYEIELAELGIDISLGKEVTIETALKGKPDAVIIATGSVWCIPDLPGIDRKEVTTASDLLLGKKKAKDIVVVIGGGHTGCETALWLAQQGKKVTIVEMLDGLMQAGIPIYRANRMMLLDLLKFHKVNILTGTTLLEVGDAGVTLVNKHFNRNTLKAGTVVLATGLKPAETPLYSLIGKAPNVHIIGDAKQPRNIMGAIWDAYEVAKNI
jgi:2-enoate reductase